jgi:hypothetical protein
MVMISPLTYALAFHRRPTTWAEAIVPKRSTWRVVASWKHSAVDSEQHPLPAPDLATAAVPQAGDGSLAELHRGNNGGLDWTFCHIE